MVGGINLWKTPIFVRFSVPGNSEKENHFLDSRGQRVFLILKSYIYKLNNSTMGCHVADAKLRATFNFAVHTHCIWMHLGVLCSNTEGWYQSHYLLKATKQLCSNYEMHISFLQYQAREGQQYEKFNENTVNRQILKKFTSVPQHKQQFTQKNLDYQRQLPKLSAGRSCNHCLS